MKASAQIALIKDNENEKPFCYLGKIFFPYFLLIHI